MKDKFKYVLIGILSGFLNGFFGAGGGAVLVPILEKVGVEEKKAHATSVLIIVLTTALSAGLYLYKGYVKIGSALPFIPSGVLGAVIGGILLSKMNTVWLKRIFGAVLIFASVRMILR